MVRASEQSEAQASQDLGPYVGQDLGAGKSEEREVVASAVTAATASVDHRATDSAELEAEFGPVVDAHPELCV